MAIFSGFSLTEEPTGCSGIILKSQLFLFGMGSRDPTMKVPEWRESYLQQRLRGALDFSHQEAGVLMSQMRKSLFASAILQGHYLFPRCLLNPTAIQKIALSKEGLRFSLDGCYVGMDGDALDGSVVLEVPYPCSVTPPTPRT